MIGNAQEAKLTEFLDATVSEGFTPEDIIILSPIRHCAASRLSTKPWDQKLSPLEEAGPGQIPYHTIQGFKGLERPVVVLTDISDVQIDEARALLYVGLTRGTQKVVAFAEESVRQQLNDIVFGSTKEGLVGDE